MKVYSFFIFSILFIRADRGRTESADVSRYEKVYHALEWGPPEPDSRTEVGSDGRLSPILGSDGSPEADFGVGWVT